MSDSLGFVVAVISSEVVPEAISLYAAYWAFAIRRALVGRMYRNHALWLGAIGVLLAGTGFITYSNDPVFVYAVSIFYGATFVVFLAFIDSTVRVARRSDPLLRSVLHWEKLRLLLWVDVGGLVVLNMIPAVNPSFASSVAGQVAGTLGWTTLGAILFVPGAAALIVGTRRSRDPLVRESLKWLGVVLSMAVVLLLFYAIEGFVFGISQFDIYYSYPALPIAVPYILMAYALYRSARSLAPMNRLQAKEPAEISPSAVATN